MASLPPFIRNGWRLQTEAEERAKAAQELDDFSTSSLAETFMRFQLDRHFAAPDPNVSSHSLASIAVAKVLDALADSGDLTADVKTIAESLNSTTLRQLLNDHRTPYQLLRTFLTLSQTLTAKDRSIVDVDEAVLRNERYVRSRDSNQDDRYLVSLEDLVKILANAPQKGGPLSFTRKDPPKGGLEMLDELRKKELAIQSSSDPFCETFDRITHGALRGLDWGNVLVASGMALTTLLHTDSSKDDDRPIRDPDIDLYIYGLSPEDANRKVEEVYDTWVRNLPVTVQARLVVKNAHTINFIPSYPHRRIQIILKLSPSPTDILLNFDLDACAIGFNGAHVLMLPRCARAIETGYSVFTMDMVWGHRLSHRAASQEDRILKYADRGFGLRILPSYARSLEEDNLEAAIFGKPVSPASASVGNTVDDEDVSSLSARKPHGPEPGLKTLKRIAHLDQNFAHRCCYEVEIYDDIPIYTWDENFSIDEFERTIEESNNHLWACVRTAICEKLGIPVRLSGYRDYLTRRIRRRVCSRDLATVQEKQITIPVIMPWALEDYLLSKIPQQYSDLPSHFTTFKPLIPLHDASKYDPSTAILPSLQDTASESGNLRYWVITNESMWAQQHRVVDETAELLWSLFYWFSRDAEDSRFRADSPDCKWHLARSFHRRIVLPDVSDHSPPVNLKSGLPSLRETLLFRPWAFTSPIMPDRRPLEDGLFWHAGDEGEWDRDGVPAWTEPVGEGVIEVD